MGENRWGSMGGDEDRDYYKTRAELLSGRLEKAEAERDRLRDELAAAKEQNNKLRFHITILSNNHGECIECASKYGDDHDTECEIGCAIAGHALIIHEVEAERDRLREALVAIRDSDTSDWCRPTEGLQNMARDALAGGSERETRCGTCDYWVSCEDGTCMGDCVNHHCVYFTTGTHDKVAVDHKCSEWRPRRKIEREKESLDPEIAKLYPKLCACCGRSM